MTSARDLLPTLRIRGMKLSTWTKLAIPAIVLTACFGLIAFLMLVWRDRSHTNVMVNEQVAPTAAAAKRAMTASAAAPATRPVAPATGAAKTGVSDIPEAGGRNEFTLNKANTTITIGTIKLRLFRTNTNRQIYDLVVQVRRHAQVRRSLRAGQPVWIARNRGEAPVEVVVRSIGKEIVSGYWEETGHAAQADTQNRSHHP